MTIPETPKNQDSARRISPVAIAIIVIIALAIFLYAVNVAGARTRFNDAVYNQLNDWKLIPTPERFTELYFQNSANLPRATVAGQPISFAFTIHNVEGITTTYPYVVYFEYPDASQVVFTSGTVTLASDASTTIPVTHAFLASNLTGKVVVDLSVPAASASSSDQQIDFLLPDTNP
jgi:hypothetical protein